METNINIKEDNFKTVDLVLSFIIQNEKILLAKKARGFGMGKINGYGGKVEMGESLLEAASRELREESGGSCNDLTQAGKIDFYFKEDKVKFSVSIFRGTHIDPAPIDTEEMIEPTWYTFSSIPYNKMWVDDVHWMENLLEGKLFQARFTFQSMRDEHSETILSHEVFHVDSLE